jgi:DnaJ-class molecular chaperone
MTAAEDRTIDKSRCRRCGGRGEVTVMETIDPDGTQSPLYDAPCPRCAGVGTEPKSVAEIISAGIRVHRGDA